jgi:predicted peroxiredoxin
MAQKTIEKKSRKKITVKPFTVEEKSILRKAFDQMRKNGVKFIKNGSSLTLSVQINGKQKVSYKPGFVELSNMSLIQRANPAIRYKKK